MESLFSSEKRIMPPIQKKLLSLMKTFDEMCRKYGVTYYLGGGSALGAVRHGGFLPWDDDVDLYIPRNEYEKLMLHKGDIFSEDFILVNHDEYPRYGNTVVRCVDPSDSAITKARIVDGTPKGSFIELFILDPMPLSPEEQDLWLKKHYVYAELLAEYFRLANPRIDESVDPELYSVYLGRCKEIGREETLAELECDLFTIDEAVSEKYCARWGTRNLIYDIDWFGEPRYVPFEDTYLPVASCAEKVLRFDYGDNWMFVPSVEDQVIHSYAQSERISYRYFVQDYLQFIDVDEVRNSYGPRKEASIDYYFTFRKNHRDRLLIKSAGVKAGLRVRGVTLPALEKMYRNKEYGGLSEAFSQWEIQQFSSAFWRWKEPIRLEDGYMFYALIPLFMQGRYYAVRTILEWASRDGALDEKCSALLVASDIISEAHIALDCGDLSGSLSYLKKLEGISVVDVESQFDYRYLTVLLTTRLQQECSRRIFAIANSLRFDYPDNGEVISLMGDCYALRGENEAAQEMYLLALEKTRHAFVFCHARKSLRMIWEGRK